MFWFVFGGVFHGWISADPQIVNIAVFNMYAMKDSQNTKRHSDKNAWKETIVLNFVEWKSKVDVKLGMLTFGANTPIEYGAKNDAAECTVCTMAERGAT